MHQFTDPQTTAVTDRKQHPVLAVDTGLEDCGYLLAPQQFRDPLRALRYLDLRLEIPVQHLLIQKTYAVQRQPATGGRKMPIFDQV